MRKYVAGGIAGTAAAMLAFSLPAQADEMDDMGGVSISGYMNHDFGFGSYDGGWKDDEGNHRKSVEDFHQEIDAELHFTATGRTDGGLTVTAVIEVDADSPGGIDESNLTIAGGFGSVNIGANDNAANMHGNKGIGGGYGGGGYYDCGESWIPASCGGPVDNSDALGIRYSTPNVGGFQAGVSFQADDSSEGATNPSTNDRNVVAIGANFSGDMGGTSLTVGGNYVSKKTQDSDETYGGDSVKSWGLGASVGIGATTLSVRYDAKPEYVKHAVAGEDRGDKNSLGIGIDHAIGALSFGIGYSTMKEEDAARDDMGYDFTAEVPADTSRVPNTPGTAANADVIAASAQDRKHTVISAGATYDLGGGVKVSAGVHHGKVTNVEAGDKKYVCVEAAADDDDFGTGQIDEDATITDGACSAGTMGNYTELKNLDDLGVGLRIAFSF